MPSNDSFACCSFLFVGEQRYAYFSLPLAEKNGLPGISQLPLSMKILLEGLLRNEDGERVTKDSIVEFVNWVDAGGGMDMVFYPSRVLMQDFAGIPAILDLASMRDAVAERGGNPAKVNPVVPVDLVVDHSVIVEFHGNNQAFAKNAQLEYNQNAERYRFLKWAQESFDNFRVVPPGTGICHQVNLEYLAETVCARAGTVWQDGKQTSALVAFPDTVVGTDSHTTMINGLSVLGWGVGGIEAEAAMLGQGYTMTVPEVIGVKLLGRLREGVTATDLVLTITQILRERKVVGKFVEFFGPGLAALSIADRATVANMAPEYGATCGFFPFDSETLAYLHKTGRPHSTIALAEAYAQAQGFLRPATTANTKYSDLLLLDLGEIEPSVAGPRRPQDRLSLMSVPDSFRKTLDFDFKKTGEGERRFDLTGGGNLGHGDIVIAAITSCTNTSNPDVMLTAGLLAKRAVERGLTVRPSIKTSMSPGSRVVAEYLKNAGLQEYLDTLGFNVVGLGCMTCVGNSGALVDDVPTVIRENDLVVAAVLSGNRNFDGRINADVRVNYLASPPLVVAYALAGSIKIDLTSEPLGQDRDGRDVYLKNIWPDSSEIAALIDEMVTRDVFLDKYSSVFSGGKAWDELSSSRGVLHPWEADSTYIQPPPFCQGRDRASKRQSVETARILAIFSDSITTDHISPVGSIEINGPAGSYLLDQGVRERDFNQYGARRGNHEVMERGTFANIRLKNQMVSGVEGGVTVHYPSGEQMTIFDAARRYSTERVPLVIVAGKEYGTGSARDYAAKGSALLGIRAVIAESFERIHRSNLIGMGVLPLCFEEGTSWRNLGLTGEETISIVADFESLRPRQIVSAEIVNADGKKRTMPLICRIDTSEEAAYFRSGGILPYVLETISF